MNFKRIICICLCLIIPVFFLSNCSTKSDEPDLTGFYKIGENFSLTSTDEFEYNITILDITEDYFTLDIQKAMLINDARVYIYSSGYTKIELNGVEYTKEELLPISFPIGVYAVPLNSENGVLKVYFAEDYNYKGNGYIKATVDTAFSSSGSSQKRFGISFIVY